MRRTSTHVFFWGGPFSNWHRSGFAGKDALAELLPRLNSLAVQHPSANDPLTLALADHRYSCGEQWMMAVKAWLFGDSIRLAEILASDQPRDQKMLGRRVSPFDPAAWDAACVSIVAAGSIARFAANPSLRDQLLATDDLILVEGSPKDRVWGVGIDWRDARIEDPSNWRGRNLLGRALAIARESLRARYAPRRRFSR